VAAFESFSSAKPRRETTSAIGDLYKAFEGLDRIASDRLALQKFKRGGMLLALE
jgi:hypothetical protein